MGPSFDGPTTLLFHQLLEMSPRPVSTNKIPGEPHPQRIHNAYNQDDAPPMAALGEVFLAFHLQGERRGYPSQETGFFLSDHGCGRPCLMSGGRCKTNYGICFRGRGGQVRALFGMLVHRIRQFRESLRAC